MKREGSERVSRQVEKGSLKGEKRLKHATGMPTDVWFAGQTQLSTFTKENCKRV
jgi:hypothetical protein